jgi:hypothetical protein|tara:strand:+ start:334 stop:612 length:279 start_codon:yes stop_codon:yes gene_type:complete
MYRLNSYTNPNPDAELSASGVESEFVGIEREYRHSQCILHLPQRVLNEVFIRHDTSIDMRTNGVADFKAERRSKGVSPNLLHLVTNTNSFGG